MQKAYLIGSSAPIRIGGEIRCLPYAGFFMLDLYRRPKSDSVLNSMICLKWWIQNWRVSYKQGYLVCFILLFQIHPKVYCKDMIT